MLSAGNHSEERDPQKTLSPGLPAIPEPFLWAAHRGRQAMNSATILVVANEPKIRHALRTTLSNSGYDVILAKKGQEAIKIVMRERPDLILLDVAMRARVDLRLIARFASCLKDRLSW
jgi:response regulator RpfG family c-di-GMP phosphodiesterase